MVSKWKKSGNGNLNCQEPEKKVKIRGLDGDWKDDEVEEEEEQEGSIFVDDDCWRFCQTRGMSLGYYWCLSEMNNLTEESSQNCRGIGVTMDKVYKTSSTSLSPMKLKGNDLFFCIQKQTRKSQKQSKKQMEINLTADKIAQLLTQLQLMRLERYETNKWVAER